MRRRLTIKNRLGEPDLRLSIIIPFFNEEASVGPLFQRLRPVLAELHPHYEIICIDDGSNDGTVEALRFAQSADARILILSLSRNFGKEAALTAGLDHASGEAVQFMDADLQHPPELIPEFLVKLSEGWDVVYGVRTCRKGETKVKRFFAGLFYSLMSRISETPLPRDAGDFRMLSRRAADAVRQLQERQRFMKGLFAWVGFRQTPLAYEVEPRRFGQSGWSTLALCRLAWNGILSFTSLPLRVWSLLGSVIAAAAAGYAGWIIIDTLINGADLPGYPTIVTAIFFLGGVQLLSVGILGEYIARIFAETKRRPIYLVRDLLKASEQSLEKPAENARIVRLDAVGN